MPCVFCKIASGEVAADKVFEDKDVVAFLDAQPLNPGHTLVIPKKHYLWVWDIEESGEYFELVKRIAITLKKALNAESVQAAIWGEAVPHAHIHLVPRFPGDGHGGIVNWSDVKRLSKEQTNDIVRKIKKGLS